MGKVVFDISMSLDGYVSGANVSVESGLGDDGERLHDWGFKSEDPRNHEIVGGWDAVGAVIVGRNTYDLSIPHWGPDGPTGAARTPTVIVSHTVPSDVPAGGVYTFVTGVETALEKARGFAGDKDISITGTIVAAQMIALGLVDEIAIHVVPVLFGSGTRLFETPGGDHISLEKMEVIETDEAVHLRYRVMK